MRLGQERKDPQICSLAPRKIVQSYMFLLELLSNVHVTLTQMHFSFWREQTQLLACLRLFMEAVLFALQDYVLFYRAKVTELKCINCGQTIS